MAKFFRHDALKRYTPPEKFILSLTVIQSEAGKGLRANMGPAINQSAAHLNMDSKASLKSATVNNLDAPSILGSFTRTDGGLDGDGSAISGISYRKVASHKRPNKGRASRKVRESLKRARDRGRQDMTSQARQSRLSQEPNEDSSNSDQGHRKKIRCKGNFEPQAAKFSEQDQLIAEDDDKPHRRSLLPQIGEQVRSSDKASTPGLSKRQPDVRSSASHIKA
jgi:hypothetical protein